ncbi:MAG: recombinase family protein [Lachnospiraceae bacterium]|nr:recombinase family protein [Lachnospiraceae bacterium]
MCKVYGYCRISRKQQSIERQVRNILAQYPDADIRQEAFTGTKIEGRTKWNALYKQVREGDTIVFDSVSRMSRNADDGIKLYMDLYQRGVNLVFLKEHHIDTDTYKKALQNQISLTGDKVDLILTGINQYLMELAREQIRLAFEQAQKEVDDLHQRTKEGIETAKRNGKQIGQKQGAVLTTKKSIQAKKIIQEHNKSFGGTLDNEETWKLAGISKMTFYKYKREIELELTAENA